MSDSESRRMRPRTIRHAIRNSIIQSALGGILPMVLFQGGIISLLVISLGGTDLEIGFISTVLNLCMVMGVLLTPYVDVRPRLRLFRIWLVVSTAAVPLLFLVQPIDILFGKVVAYWVLVAVIFVHYSAANIAGSAWMPYLADLLPAPVRGQYFGRMRVAWRISSLAVTLLAAALLGSDPTMIEFYLVFGVAIVLSLARFAFVSRLPAIPPVRCGRPESMWKTLRAPFRDGHFVRFLAFLFAVYLITSAGPPFMIPFLKTELGYPSSITVFAGSFVSVGCILSLMIWGRVADARGSRFVFLTGLAVMSLALAVFSLPGRYAAGAAGSFTLAALGFVLRGIGISGVGIGYTVRLMSESPARERGSYMIVARLVVGAAAAIGPLLSGSLLERLRLEIGPEGSPAGALAGGIPTKRVFFLIVSALMALTIPLVRLLRRIKEEHTTDILRSILYTTMYRLGDQVTFIGRVLGRHNGSAGGRDCTDAQDDGRANGRSGS